MIKKPLKDHFRTADYSMLEPFKRGFHKYHLKEMIELDEEGTFYKAKILEAFKYSKSLNNTLVKEYFRLQPWLIDSMKNLPSFIDCDDLEDYTIGQVFRIIGSMEDLSPDYSKGQQYAETIELLVKPIVDSGFDHPLYRMQLCFTKEMAYRMTGDPCCELNKLERMNLLFTMNDILKETYHRGPSYYYPYYFNNLIIPTLVLQKHLDPH